MRVAILGSRGIPAIIGGFETLAEQVGARLAARGHDVTVYCERNLYPGRRPENFRGVRLVHLPALPSKSLEALSYDLLCAGHALFGGYDLVYMLADNTAVSLVVPRLCGARIVINTDGIEWQRSKWPWYGRLFLKFNEWLATRLTAHLVVDAREMGAYFKRRYGRETTYITNGTEIIRSGDPGLVRRLGLDPGAYLAVVCRLEPENSVETIVREFRATDRNLKLAIAGGANYRSRYVRRLTAMARDDNRIVFLGVLPDWDALRELRVQALAYIHGHQVGGTNPSLVEAMGAGNIILANRNPFNREVAGEAAIYWTAEPGDLRDKILEVEDNRASLKALGEKARRRAAEFYSWDDIAARTESYFQAILREQ
jgi:glycosyltransferase involved in cell wall biosynthesis